MLSLSHHRAFFVQITKQQTSWVKYFCIIYRFRFESIEASLLVEFEKCICYQISQIVKVQFGTPVHYTLKTKTAVESSYTEIVNKINMK